MPSQKVKDTSITFGLIFFCLSLISIVLVKEATRLRDFTQIQIPPITPQIQSLPRKLQVLFEENFTGSDLAGWREKGYTGKTKYTVETGKTGNQYLKATSNQSASYLIKKIQFDPNQYPNVSWRWKVDKLTSEADMRLLQGSDAPARVYIAFSDGFGIWNTKLVNYVWASSMEEGDQLRSYFSPNSRIIVLQSGSEKLGNWVWEERNVAEDYRALFGKDPPKAEAIAVMTDSDNTNSDAIASYDDLSIWRKPPLSSPPETP